MKKSEQQLRKAHAEEILKRLYCGVIFSDKKDKEIIDNEISIYIQCRRLIKLWGEEIRYERR